MNHKFYNYLYDYMVKETLISNKNPKDQKEKMKYAKEYLERINKTHVDSKLNMLKNMYLDKYIIKYEDIPESYWEHLEKINLEKGLGHNTITEREKLEKSKMIINDQTKTFQKIFDYFFSEEAKFYPTELKFWAFQGIINLGQYNRQTKKYSKRSKGTTSPFIDINREALALTITEMEKLLKKEKITDEKFIIDVLNNNLNNSFIKIYNHYLEKLNSNHKIDEKNIEGIWIKYNRGGDYIKLCKSLEGKSTGWCTAGESVAKEQLTNGDFYIYYTKDNNNEYTEPRIAIRMDSEGHIAEIRGVAEDQNIESDLENIVEEKLKEFSDRDRYKKKVSDMKTLTTIYKKIQINNELTKEEIIFLYEIYSEIDGFGQERDPRIEEILSKRDIKTDLAYAFDCNKEEIGISPEPLTNIPFKVYCGDLITSKEDKIECKKMPKVIKGRAYLEHLTTLEEIELPEYVSNNFYLDNVTEVNNKKISTYVGGIFQMNNLKKAENTTFPPYVGRNAGFYSLKEAKNVIFPNKILGGIDLNSLEEAENIDFGEEIGKSLYAPKLEKVKNIKLPKIIRRTLSMFKIKSLDEFIIPEDYEYNHIYMPELTEQLPSSKKVK